MSRLGKKPITIPAGVNVSINNGTISISKGDSKLDYTFRPEVQVAWNEDEKSVVISIDEKDIRTKGVRAYWGLTRALIQNMVIGDRKSVV